MTSRTRSREDVKFEESNEATGVVRDEVENLARQGARTVLMAALEDEVDAYLGRGRYERTGTYRG